MNATWGVVRWAVIALMLASTTLLYGQGSCDVDPAKEIRAQDNPAMAPQRWADCNSPADEIIEGLPKVVFEGIPSLVLKIGEECRTQFSLNDADILKARDKIMTVCPAFGPGQFACSMTYLLGKLGKDASRCIVKGVVNSAPIKEDNKKMALSALQAYWNIADRQEFIDKARNVETMSADQKYRFFEKLQKDWVKDLLGDATRVEVVAPGFERFVTSELTLLARQTLRVDASLTVSAIRP